MADQSLALKGRLKIRPVSALVDPSGLAVTDIDFLTNLDVKNKLDTIYTLAADPAETVNFGDIVNANVVMLVPSTKVKAALTSADGAAQVIPVGGPTILNAGTVPFTAMTLQRETGVSASVRVVIVEKLT